MNIHIIGAGAIGLFFAAEWSGHHRVTLQTRTKKQKELLDTEGICVKEKGKTAVSFVETAESAPCDTQLLVVAVKQYHLPSVLSELPPSPSVLFIQNGLSHLDLLKKLAHFNIYAGSVEHGIAKEDGRTIRVNGRNQTKLAAVKGGTKKLAADLQTSQFLFNWSEDAYSMLVDKMAANAVINPLTALLNIKNGHLAENQSYRSAVESLCSEFSLVFPSKRKEDITASVLEICRKTADNESSMLKDMKEGKETEIEAILGALLAEAKSKSLPVPAFQLLYELVKGKIFEAR